MNRLVLSVLLASILASPIQAQPVADGTLLETLELTWPEFEAVRGAPRSVTREEYEATKSDARFVMETLRYSSDGIVVHAYAYRPRLMASKSESNGQSKLPVIVYCRGGYLERDLRAALAPVFRRYAEAGYVVVAPMLRESDGTGGKDEVGGADLADLMNVVPLVRQLPWADASRMYMLGVSRGGMMVYQAVRDGFPAKAVVTIGAFTDFTRLIDAHPDVYVPLVHKIWSDYDERKNEIRERRSAVLWAERLKVPLLILHGGADSGLDPRHSLDLAAKLQASGAAYEIHVIQGGDHTLERLAPARDRALLDWFGRFK